MLPVEYYSTNAREKLLPGCAFSVTGSSHPPNTGSLTYLHEASQKIFYSIETCMLPVLDTAYIYITFLASLLAILRSRLPFLCSSFWNNGNAACPRLACRAKEVFQGSPPLLCQALQAAASSSTLPPSLCTICKCLLSTSLSDGFGHHSCPTTSPAPILLSHTIITAKGMYLNCWYFFASECLWDQSTAFRALRIDYFDKVGHHLLSIRNCSPPPIVGLALCFLTSEILA